jgi:hypothetical protein
VFEIMGIDPQDKNYSCHHIVFRSDFRENPDLDKNYCDSKANLFPLPIEEHERLHGLVEEKEEREERVLYRAPKRRPGRHFHKHKKLKRGGVAHRHVV